MFHPSAGSLAYDFGTVETSLVVTSSDARRDLPDRDDTPVQAVCRNGLDRRRRNLGLEPADHSHLDGSRQELPRTLKRFKIGDGVIGDGVIGD